MRSEIRPFDVARPDAPKHDDAHISASPPVHDPAKVAEKGKSTIMRKGEYTFKGLMTQTIRISIFAYTKKRKLKSINNKNHF